MREIRLKDIQGVCKSPAGNRVKKQISVYMSSNPDYHPGRKRPRNQEEAEILKSFSRK